MTEATITRKKAVLVSILEEIQKAQRRLEEIKK